MPRAKRNRHEPILHREGLYLGFCQNDGESSVWRRPESPLLRLGYVPGPLLYICDSKVLYDGGTFSRPSDRE